MGKRDCCARGLVVVQGAGVMRPPVPRPQAGLPKTRCPCIVGMLRERLDNVRVDSPPAPDIVGALGAALHAAR